MNFPKDLYFYIMKYVDNKTIIKMLSVNRTYILDKNFELILRNKYPLSIHLKKIYENWRFFSFRLFYYMDKLEKDFDIPYIASKEFDPECLYLNSSDNESLILSVLCIAAKVGNVNIIKKFECKINSYDCFEIAKKATRKGQFEVVEYLVDYIHNDFCSSLLTIAILKNNLKIVKLLFSNFFINFFDDTKNWFEKCNKDIINKKIIEYLNKKFKL